MATGSTAVSVAVRVRPLIHRERSEFQKHDSPFWTYTDTSIAPIDPDSKKPINASAYSFDHVFGTSSDTKHIYDQVVEPIVSNALLGFHGTVFCYGQTSSGKTYTLYGSENDPGIISLCAQDLFKKIKEDEKNEYLIRVALIEIYNEKVTDLLNAENPIEIKEVKGVVVPKGVNELKIMNPEDLLDAAKRVQRERRIGETRMNKESSRSHTILRICIESWPSKDDFGNGSLTSSMLNFIDLAGSEKASQTGATGNRLKEAININRSLSALSQVIMQLSEESKRNLSSGSGSSANSSTMSANSSLSKTGRRFISFRDSKLTRILTSSLDGNAYIAIICNVTPASSDETHSTLRFARSAKNIKVKPQINQFCAGNSEYELRIQDLQSQLSGRTDEINFLRKQLEIYQKICQSRELQDSERRKTCFAVFPMMAASSMRPDIVMADSINKCIPSRRFSTPSRVATTSGKDSSFIPGEEAIKAYEWDKESDFSINSLKSVDPDPGCENRSVQTSFIDSNPKQVEMADISTQYEVVSPLSEVVTNSDKNIQTSIHLFEEKENCPKEYASSAKKKRKIDTISFDFERSLREEISFLSHEKEIEIKEKEEQIKLTEIGKAETEITLDTLRSKKNQLELQLNMMSSHNIELSGTVEELNKKIENLEDKITLLEKQLVHERDESSSLFRKNNDVQVKSKELYEKLREVERKLESCTTESDELFRENEELKEKLDSAELLRRKAEKEHLEKTENLSQKNIKFEEYLASFEKNYSLLLESNINITKKFENTEAEIKQYQLRDSEFSVYLDTLVSVVCEVIQQNGANYNKLEEEPSAKDKLVWIGKIFKNENDSLRLKNTKFQEQLYLKDETLQNCNSQVLELQAENSVLRKQLEDQPTKEMEQMRGEKDSLLSKLEQLQGEKDSVSLRLEQLEMEKESISAQLEASVKQHKAEIESHIFQSRVLSAENEELNQKMTRIEGDRMNEKQRHEIEEADMAQNLASAEAKLKISLEDNSKLKAENDELNQLKHRETDMNSVISQLQEENRGLIDKVSRLEDMQSESKLKLQAALDKNDQSQKQLSCLEIAAKEEKEQLELKNTILEENLSDRNQAIKTSEETLLAIKKQYELNSSEKLNLEKQLALKSEDYDSLKKVLEAISLEKASLNEELESKSIDYEHLKEQLELKLIECENVEKELYSRSLECDSLKNELKSLRTECSKLKEELDCRLDKCLHLEDQLKLRSNECCDLKEHLTSKTIEHENIQERFKSLFAEHSILTQELKLKSTECEKMDVQLNSKSIECENMKEQLNTISSECSDLKEQLISKAAEFVDLKEELDIKVLEMSNISNTLHTSAEAVLSNENKELRLRIEEIENELARQDSQESAIQILNNGALDLKELVSNVEGQLQEAKLSRILKQQLLNLEKTKQNLQDELIDRNSELDTMKEAKVQLEIENSKKYENLLAEKEKLMCQLSSYEENFRIQMNDLKKSHGSKLVEMISENQNLSQKLEKVKNVDFSKGSCEVEIASLTEEVRIKSSKLESVEKALSEKENQLQSLKTALADAQNQVNSLEESHEYFNEKQDNMLQEAREQLTAALEKCRKLEEQLESLQKEKCSLAMNHLNEKKIMEDDLSTLSDKIRRLEEAQQQAEENMEIQKSQYKSLAEKLSLISAECEELKLKCKLKAETIEEIEGQLKRKLESLNACSSKCRALSAENNEVKNRVKDLEQQHLRETSTLVDERNELLEQREKYEERWKEYEKVVNDLKNMNTVLSNQLQEEKTEKEKLKNESLSFSKEIGLISQDLKNSRKEMERMEEEKSQMLQKLRDNSELFVLKRELEIKSSYLGQLKEELKDSWDENKALKQEKTRLNSIVENITKQLENCKAQLQAVETKKPISSSEKVQSELLETEKSNVKSLESQLLLLKAQLSSLEEQITKKENELKAALLENNELKSIIKPMPDKVTRSCQVDMFAKMRDAFKAIQYELVKKEKEIDTLQSANKKENEDFKIEMKKLVKGMECSAEEISVLKLQLKEATQRLKVESKTTAVQCDYLAELMEQATTRKIPGILPSYIPDVGRLQLEVVKLRGQNYNLSQRIQKCNCERDGMKPNSLRANLKSQINPQKIISDAYSSSRRKGVIEKSEEKPVIGLSRMMKDLKESRSNPTKVVRAVGADTASRIKSLCPELSPDVVIRMTRDTEAVKQPKSSYLERLGSESSSLRDDISTNKSSDSSFKPNVLTCSSNVISSSGDKVDLQKSNCSPPRKSTVNVEAETDLTRSKLKLQSSFSQPGVMNVLKPENAGSKANEFVFEGLKVATDASREEYFNGLRSKLGLLPKRRQDE